MLMFIFILKLLLVAVLGYLLGSVNTSIIVGKIYKVDVRKQGSGNAGTTNTLRVLGKKAAIFVIAGDVLKGVIACLIGRAILGQISGVGDLGVMLGGITAIVGHNWPIFFGFKGGKGALTSITVVMMMDFRIGIIILCVFLLVVAIKKYVSLGSIVGAVLFPIIAVIPIFEKSTVFVIFAFILAFLAIFMHRSNIERIFKGTEAKFGSKKNV